MKPNSVGIHPSNRSGSGLIPAKCHKKLTDVAKSGFSLIECARACAVGRVHESIGDGYELQSIQVIMNSGGQSPCVSAGMIEVVSLRRRHTNAALRVGGGDVSSDDPTRCLHDRVPLP